MPSHSDHGFLAKEIIGIKNGTICKGDGYGQEVDIWALGVLTYMLVSGLPPFNGKSHADVIWMPGATSAHMCLACLAYFRVESG